MSLRSINIAPRAFISFAVIALFVLLLGGFALNRMGLIRGAATDIGNNWLPSITYLGQINENMLRLRILSFRTLVNRDPDSLKESDRRTNELVDKLKAARDKYAPLVSSPEEKTLYNKFAGVMEVYLADQAQMLALSQKGDIDALRTHINTRIKADTDQLGDLFNQLIALNKTGSEAALTEAGMQYSQATEGVVAVIVVAALLTITLALLLTRSIVAPLSRALRVAEEIAGGNLTRPILVDGKDEAARLLEALGAMQDNLRNTIQQISGSATQLASAAVELSAVTEEASLGLQRQNDEIEQAATAVNEMTSAVEEVARNAVSTSEASRESSDAAQSGRDRVVQTVNAIQAMSQDVQTTTGLVEGLAERARDIGKVLDVIRSIAEQTNLLALNAAIEAARAGEAGRGFAVVADEVRALAHRTQESTREIEQMISGIQNGTGAAVDSMQSSSTRTQTTLDLARAAGVALEQITQTISLINERNLVIASASEEQAQVSREVDRNLVNIRDLAVQSAAGANQTSTASHELSRLATDLNQMVARFVV